MNVITINKQAKSIIIINNGIAFSQFGIAKEILDLIDNQQQEIDRLNNIINELEEYKYAVYKIKQYINSYNPYFIDTQEDNNKKIANIINEIGKKKLKVSD